MNLIKDKIILITGSTDGIGKQTALELTQKGAIVIVHGREPNKTREVVNDIRRISGNTSVDYMIADFSSLEEVKTLSTRIHEKYDRLDVLINNAGVYMQQKELSKDGFEMTFAVNHLAHFLLTHLLLDLIQKSEFKRIINVASMAHAHEIDFENLQSEKSFGGYSAYALSKLCNILFTYELARRIEGTGATANCLHPGVIRTKLLRNGWGMGGDAVESGAKTSVYLATSADVSSITGQYFSNRRPAHSAPVSHDHAVQDRLWKVSSTMVSLFLS
jgi:NAD(P)-dependent dehydrogenase (short-subunit alcohol dehydrogenase family)